MASTAVKPVVVGIDGSEQSAHAALWAVEEALGRDVPLRLVYIVRTDLTGPLSAEEYRIAVDDAKVTLHSVRSEIEAAGRPVVVETEILEGSPAGVLLAESPYASMICLGSSGMGRLGRALLGSTAGMVAERASCSVAIVRSPRESETADGHTKWVMVPVRIFTDNDIIDAAVDQAACFSARWRRSGCGSQTSAPRRMSAGQPGGAMAGAIPGRAHLPGVHRHRDDPFPPMGTPRWPA